jgi:glycosyltransferase involved in cell wall biosynthesis
MTAIVSPTVSVILPTLNERGFITDCLESFLAQDYANLLEILVVDGGSTDGTRDLVERAGPPVRLVANPRVTAAAALNVGLAEAKGDVIVRADAHTIYDADYVRRCVEVLEETGADNVGGRMRPVGTTNFGRAVAAITSSPLGVGPGKFHYSEQRADVDTVYLGCWRRTTLERLGGFDEDGLQWGAEDDECNLRLVQSGGRIVLDPTIKSWYFPRETPKALARQYFNYGVGKVSVLAKHRTLPTWRPLVPAALVAGSVVALVAGRGWQRVAIPVLHSGVVVASALKLSDDPGVAPHRAAIAVEICHWSYGAGFWAGLWRWVRGRGFDSRPRGHR